MHDWTQALLNSYRQFLGSDLIDRSGTTREQLERLDAAPFLLVSQRFASEPFLNYANNATLNLLEMDREALVRTPARFTAEPMLRAERLRMLEETRQRGFSEGYGGVRISSTGRRFIVEAGTIWNVVGTDGTLLGQAARFPRWRALENTQMTAAPSSVPATLAAELVRILETLGIERAMGVSGGAIAPLWAALANSSIPVYHFRHESGAAFAATESYFASGRASVVFATTGPGLANAMTGIMAARAEGAKVILLSAFTAASHRGRMAFQETSARTWPLDGFFADGPIFHYAKVIESPPDLIEVGERLSQGIASADGFVAHLSIPTVVQASQVAACLRTLSRPTPAPLKCPSDELIDRCVSLLVESDPTFAIWVGFGARRAAAQIRQLAEATGAAVFCSPRAKGIFPESHPQFVGVTGFGGHVSALEFVRDCRPHRILVLGTRLGELTSFWNPAFVPEGGFIHVDHDPSAPGTAYPQCASLTIESDISLFLNAVLAKLPRPPQPATRPPLPRPRLLDVSVPQEGAVRPSFLLESVQQIFVAGSDAIIMGEPGNSLAWANHLLRFAQPGRYRASLGFSSMGHTVTGVLGAALATGKQAVSIAGDGAMLMLCEVNTAVKYRLPVVWIVLNDAAYNMCEQGMALLGYQNIDAKIPEANLAMIAQGMGAQGLRVTREAELVPALEQARASRGPVVVDVIIDATVRAPFGARLQSLRAQGATLPNGAAL